MSEATLFDTGEPLKHCKKCKQNKPITGFGLDFDSRSGKSRRHSYCRPCASKIAGTRTPEQKERHRLCELKRSRSPKGKEYSRKWSQSYHASGKGFSAYRKRHTAKLYGLSHEEYEAMAKSQDGLCAICGRSETVKRKGRHFCLSVDHDHKRNGRESVRGLLCRGCNTLLGLVGDDISHLEAAISYLKKWK